MHPVLLPGAAALRVNEASMWYVMVVAGCRRWRPCVLWGHRTGFRAEETGAQPVNRRRRGARKAQGICLLIPAQACLGCLVKVKTKAKCMQQWPMKSPRAQTSILRVKISQKLGTYKSNFDRKKYDF